MSSIHRAIERLSSVTDAAERGREHNRLAESYGAMYAVYRRS